MKLLHGSDLAEAVRNLFATENQLLCAVAFWGPEYSKLALDCGALVILDVSMGCTSKSSLEVLGIGPKKVSEHALEHVRVLDGLHAKLFLGANRCILGSANASGAALGRAGGPPKLFEAAIELERQDDPVAFAAVEALWKSYLKASREARLADYIRAPRVAATSAARDRRSESLETVSILHAVLEQPDRFNRTAFAFGDHEIDKPELDDANAAYTQKHDVAPKAHSRLHICTTDPKEEVDEAFRCADKIISFWFGRSPGLYTYHDIVRVEHDEAVSYYGRRSWTYVGGKVGLGHLLVANAWRADEKAAHKLSMLEDDKKGRRYVALSADALSEVLERSSPN